MQIEPLGDKVAIRPARPEIKSRGGVVLGRVAREKPKRGTVVAVGDGRRADGQVVPVSLEVGDEVFFASYRHQEVTVGGEELVILQEEWILGKIVP